MGPVPGQHNLGGGGVVGFCNLANDGVLQQIGAVTQGAPGFSDDTQLRVDLAQVLLGEVGVQLNLVDGGHNAGFGDDFAQLLFGEVRDADGLGLALLLQFNQGLPGLGVEPLGGLSPVNQEQVDVVGAQAGQGLVRCLEGLLVALVVVPDLGGEEDILASYTGVSNCLAGTFFIAIDFGGVDVAVAGIKGQAYDLFGGVVFYLPDAVAQLGGCCCRR